MPRSSERNLKLYVIRKCVRETNKRFVGVERGNCGACMFVQVLGAACHRWPSLRSIQCATSAISVRRRGC